jgi:dihydrofolate reductase
MSVSLDGYVAGPGQSLEHPHGRRGLDLHHWHLDEPLNEADRRTRDLLLRPRGAYVMGRNMFGGGPGPWPDEPWNGWWGENPPFHLPVFVVTHHERPPLECDGGTTFTFVTDGVEVAVAQAREAAGGRDVAISGGATVARQSLAAGLLDELRLDLVPVLLGDGVRLFDGDTSVDLEQVSVVEGHGVTHLAFRVQYA